MKSLHPELILFIGLTILLAAVLLGCVQPPAASEPAATPTGENPNTPPEVTRPAPLPAAVNDLPELASGNTWFAYDLYQVLREEEGNLFFSPYSISAALAMTYAGARGETERQMAETLHFTLPQERLHPAFYALDDSLSGGAEAGEAAFQLNIANSLWGQEGFPFRQDFVDKLVQNYGAGMRLVDYKDNSSREVARQEINRWVEEKTQDKIQDLIKPGILTELTRLVLANAIYFKGKWVYPFLNGTHDAPFTRLDGSQVAVPMMSVRENLPYTEAENYQAVELPYQGDRISMIVVLPAEGQFAAFEESLTKERVDSIQRALQTTDLFLYMPKFSFSSNLLLEETLPALGMPDAFDPEKADFTGMYDPSLTGETGLHIAHVVHQAFVAVDEEGTEAAAATGVVMEVESMPLTLNVDRPFIFLIYDRQTGTILFMGRTMDPSSED